LYIEGISSALKTWHSYYAVEGLEKCRRAMGGHAYSSYNSIGDIINVFQVITTGGGDNTVLGQQCAAYLLSTFRRAIEVRSFKNL
jgi:acyl-CoA oxidase